LIWQEESIDGRNPPGRKPGSPSLGPEEREIRKGKKDFPKRRNEVLAIHFFIPISIRSNILFSPFFIGSLPFCVLKLQWKKTSGMSKAKSEDLAFLNRSLRITIRGRSIQGHSIIYFCEKATSVI
jgi:hypothetical protein